MFHSALVVQRSKNDHGAYQISQVANSEPTSKLCDYRSKNRVTFNSVVDIFAVYGSINTETLETELTLEVYGISLGIFHGVPNQAFKINLDLSMVKGAFELRLNAFDELWLDIDTKNFQVAENGPGQFIWCRKAHLIRNMPGVRCAPWVSADVRL